MRGTELGPEDGGVGVGFEPAVEGGLGLFEEADGFGESGFGGGVDNDTRMFDKVMKPVIQQLTASIKAADL